MERIYSRNLSFIDDLGRERIFNGINICDKGTFNGKNRDYIYSWEEGRAQKLRNCGINIIRLGITWDALEPNMNKYNEKYFDAIEKIMDECADNNIYIYLDMHQDLFSGFGNGPGDGAPKWACVTEGHEYQMPKFIWDESYFFDKAVSSCFDNFWKNTALSDRIGVQDHYIKLWQKLAERFGNHPALMGFDVMNEPFIGSKGRKVFRKIAYSAIRKTLFDRRIDRAELIKKLKVKGKEILALDLYSGQTIIDIVSAASKDIESFERDYYMPFLERATAAIRKETDNGIIFIENNYYSNTGIPCTVSPIKINAKTDEKQAFAPHGYDLMVDTPFYKYANNDRLNSIFGARRKEQKESLKMPVVVGEWGGNAEGNEWLPHVEFLLSLFDKYQWSNTYWAYTKDILTSDLMGVLKRPYPIAVEGSIESYEHNRDENTFELIFNQTQECKKGTEIFLHKKPKEIECQGEYNITALGDDASVLTVKTNIGLNKIKILFEGEGFSYTAISKIKK